VIVQRPISALLLRRLARPIGAAALFAVPACDPGATVLNVAPAVTAVGPVTFVDGKVHIGVWLRDHERNSVDLTINAELDGQAVALDDLEVGLIGLTTERDAPGRYHSVIWTPATVSAGSTLRLRVSATDSAGDTGLEASTPEFTLSEGLDAP